MIKTLKTLAVAAILMMPAIAHASPETGKPAPNFTATNILNGESFDLSDHKGKIVVLEWTNHQCPYVIKHYDTGNMQKVQKQVLDMGDVAWVSIVSSAPGKQGHVTAEEATAIVEKENAHPTAKILDESGEIGQLYGAKTTPHMFVINADGALAYAGAIDDNDSPRHETVEGATNYVVNAVSALKTGESVAVSTTQPYGCGVKY